MNSPKPDTSEIASRGISLKESVQRELSRGELSRREFLRTGAQCVACCTGGALLLTLGGCGSDDEAASNAPAGVAASPGVQAVSPTQSPQGTFTLVGFAKSPPDKALVFETPAKEPVVVFRVGEKWQALSAKCTHSGCTVEWRKSGKDRFVCPCHNSRFDEQGKVLSGPAKSPLPAYSVKTVGNDLIVKLA